jgi:hypothetical protein
MSIYYTHTFQTGNPTHATGAIHARRLNQENFFRHHMGPNILLAVGSLLIFGTFLRSSDQMMNANTQIAEQNEYYLTALSLAQSVIAEAKTKAFDQNTVASPVSSPDSLSGFLGQDGSGEAIPTAVPYPDTLIKTSPYTAATPGFRSNLKFNDVDDYNGYKRLVNTQRAEAYTITSKVVFASPTYPDSTKVSTKTFCKRMTVTVKSPYIPDSVVVSYAFVY